MSVTAEEQGLLGSKRYATHPLYPLNKTLADFNMDVLNTYGATHDTQVIGAGQNSVEDPYAQVAAKHGRVVVTDNEHAKGDRKVTRRNSSPQCPSRKSSSPK